MSNILLTVLTGGVLGVLGQGVRVLIGEGLCKALAGHNDHIHLQIKVPSKQILITT